MTVVVGGASLPIEDLVAAARGEPIRLDDGALPRIEAGAARFAQALGRTAGTDDSGIAIEPVDGAPSGPPPRSNDGPRHHARPTGPRGPRTGQPHRGAPRSAPSRSGPR